ncbi:Calreticulin [Clonorchis sinensis]|uniref:Calreticulin n=2 Tax=Clonorchis sinensis TaxID=79923 RepID=A0A419PXK8_CLOSI|nr:Calreticulin [Clonorchis sinensis]
MFTCISSPIGMWRSSLLAFLALSAYAEVYLYEHFSKDSIGDKPGQWVESKHHSDETRGTWELFSNEAWKNPEDVALKTSVDARYYGISRKLDKPFSNRDKTLVVQYIVKYEQSVSCGGAYLKLLPSNVDQKTFHGETPYLFMFGPDICGYSTKKVHAIFSYKGKNHLIKKEVRCKDDLVSHLYTFILTPDNKFKILIDNEQVEEGNLEDDWDMLLPKEIDDPASKKPEDWVDEEEIDDPDDKKPEDWDKPKDIPDPDAKKPEDWDDEMDGEWERPKIPNPEYRGEWHPRKIANPNYKGPWVAPKISNPDYQPDPDLYVRDDIAHVGFELWQVTSGSVFDEILITDDPQFAKEEGERVWRPRNKLETEFEKKREEAEKAKTSEETKEESGSEGDSDKEEPSEKETSDDSTEPTDSESEASKTHEEL